MDAVAQNRTAAKLERLWPEILRLWEDNTRREVRAAEDEDRLVLFDELPCFLAGIVQELNGEVGPGNLYGGDVVCVEHGEQRARETGYHLNAVMLEYRLLRKSICKVLEAEDPLPLADRETITDCIEMAMRDAAGQFMAVHQEMLQQRAAQLIEADRRKNEFVVTLAHELRTPLSAVTNALYILENIQMDDRGLRQLNTANRQVRHLARLVEDIMDVTRIAEGKINLQKEALPVSRVAGSAAQAVQPFIDSRGQELFCSFTPEFLMVEADPARLEQVITNLLNNAAKYTEPGGNICLSTARDGDEAVVTVKDTGIGIDSVVLPQVFDLFAQVDASPERSHGGLGIGLALVKRLVELHGGSVSARSPGCGQGSEFSVRLPILKSTADVILS